MTAKIEAVVFDADGTILDTRELIFEAFQHVLAEHGYVMPPASEFVRFGGHPIEDSYAHFAPSHDPATLSHMHRAYQEERLDLFTAFEGLHDLLAALKREGLKLGICTNRSGNVIDLLERLGIKDEFGAIMHADLMTNRKPHAEGLLRVGKLLGVAPSRMVMVGDTDIDIAAGKAAGCACTIGVTHGIGTRQMLEAAGADYIIEHLNALLPLVIPA